MSETKNPTFQQESEAFKTFLIARFSHSCPMKKRTKLKIGPWTLVLNPEKNGFGEYRVMAWKHGIRHEAADYFTDNWPDALATQLALASILALETGSKVEVME